MPKQKDLKSENEQDVEEMNEEKYYQNPKDVYTNASPDHGFSSTLPNTIKHNFPRERSNPRNPNFVRNPSPSLRDCDVTRPIKKPTLQDKINKIKDGSYINQGHPNRPMMSGKSIDSFPVRLNSSNASESEEQKSMHMSSEFETPEEVEKIYRDIFRDVNNNSQQQLTTLSQKSKQSNPQASQREFHKDWALTPLYEEYQRKGRQVFKNIDESKYYSKEEVGRVYDFVNSRYNSKEYDKSVISFYKRAMATLWWILEDQMDLNTFKKIQAIYSKVDVTNTLKLLIRCQLVYQARANIVEIFENIRIFKLLKSKLKNLISLHLDFKGDASNTTKRMKRM